MMKLQLELLDRTKLTWTLEPDNRSYTVGSDPTCDIVLPYKNLVCDRHLKIRYNPQESKWYLKDLNSTNGTFIDKSSIAPDTPTPIRGQTYISLGGNITLLATPEESRSSTSRYPALETSTRLLCGYAYLGGILNGFELLNKLRSDPYKAQVPGSSLDLEKITLHATQSVITSLGYAIFALLIALIQLWIIVVFGWNWKLQLVIALIPAFTIAYELIYVRWNRARQFLKKKYKSQNDFMRIKQKWVSEIVDFFRKQVFQENPSQNIITFGGEHPFIGAGERIPHSSWIIPILRRPVQDKNKEEKEADGTIVTQITGNTATWNPDRVDIPTHEFYQAADRGIFKLGLPSLETFSQLFVDGFELEVDKKILTKPTTRPAAISLDDPLWTQEKPASSQRSYRVYRYVDVERDYVLSFFLRFYNVGIITFVESSAYILPGIDRDKFSLASVIDDMVWLRILTIVLSMIILLPGLYIPIAIWYISIFIFNLASWKINNYRQKRAAISKEEYNYGVAYTFREFIAEKLNLDIKRDLKKTRGVQNKNNFQSYFRFKKIITNPIVLILLFILGPFLIGLGLIGIIIYFVSRFYQKSNKEIIIKTNLDYYGTQDLLMYWQAIQESLFKSTVTLLKHHQIDTSQLEQIFQQVVNNGIIVNANNLSGNVNQIQNSGVVGGVSMGGGTVSNFNMNQVS